MPLSCVSAPRIDEEEALEAKFFAAGSTLGGRSSFRADMSPSYADTDSSASIQFDTPDGTHVLAKRWTHPDGPRPFHPRCHPRAVVAKVPGAKKHRCLLVNVGDALVVHNFNPRQFKSGLERDDESAHEMNTHLSSPPIRVLTFPGTTVTAIAHRELYDDDEKSAFDVLVGLGTGEVLLTSLRALIADRDGRSLPKETLKFNTDGGGGNGGCGRVIKDVLSSSDEKSSMSKTASRCTSVAWFKPKAYTTYTGTGDSMSKDGDSTTKDSSRLMGVSDLFLSTHADGNAYVYSAGLGDGVDPRFTELRGSDAVNAVSLTMARGFLDLDVTKEDLLPEKMPNPFARMRVGPAALTAAAVAPGGEAVALAAADGQVRVLDVRRVAKGDVALVDGFKSHFGGVDAIAWAEGPPDFYDDDGDKTRGAPRLGRFRADVCVESQPATPRFLLAGGEADVVEVWDRPRRFLAARTRGHASWIAHIAETPPRGPRDLGDEGESDAVFVADESADAPSPRGAYDDLLGEAAESRRLSFASAGQDCRVCFWEMDVDPAPAWWIPFSLHRPDFKPRDWFETPRSANVDVPGGGVERASDDENRALRDENEAPPFVPARVALGAAPEASCGADAAADSADLPEKPPSSSLPSSALASSLMFPTLREDALPTEDVFSKKTNPVPFAVSCDDVFGDGKVIARAASSRSTPCIAPFSAHVAHAEPCTSLAFVDEGIITTCGGGVVKLWRRT